MSEPQPVCPICRGAGFVRRDLPPNHPEFGRAQVCQCSRKDVQRRHRQQMVALSNLGMLSRMTFETFRPAGYGMEESRRTNLEVAHTICRAYAEDPLDNGQPWLLLIGGYGCGKTHLAAAIANRRIEKGDQPLFVVVPDLLDHLRATFAPHSEVGYDERFHQVRNATLLILDDLGTQAATPWAQEKLFQIFNHRYNAQLPTIVTTNLQLEEIDVRLRSRLADMELCQTVTILAPDYRQSGVDATASDLSTLSLLSHMTFDGFDLRAWDLSDSEQERLQHAFNVSYHFAQDPSGWLVLAGNYSVGKTHLAAAVANLYQSAHPNALFIVVPDLLDHLRATYNPQSSVTYDKRFEQVRRAPLLVLDDLGTQNATPWAQEKLYQLFNFRYMARLPTIITLNDIGQVEPRLLERMMEMKAVGQGSLLQLDIPPYRSGRSNDFPGGRSGAGRVIRGGRRRNDGQRW